MAEIIVKTRDQWRDDYLKWIRLRNPLAKTGPGESYWLMASSTADQLAVMSANALVLSGRAGLGNMTGQQLDDYGDPIGLPRGAAGGASGWVEIQAGVSGTTIQEDDEAVNDATQLIYRAKRTATLADGDQIDVQCTETGPETNVDAGTVLTWTSPRPGCYASCTVAEQTDGSGLSGGRDRQGDDDYREALRRANSNPAALGNDAEIQRLAMDSNGEYVRMRYGSTEGGHGVAVEQAFTYPAFLGPGTTGLTFTLKPQTATGQRAPNSSQLTAVLQHVDQWLSADEGVVAVPIVEDDVDVGFRVSWAQNGWANPTPWPPYMAEGSHYIVGIVVSSSEFFLNTYDSVYTGGDRVAPQAGDVIAVFDADAGVFRRKAIQSISGTGPYHAICETAANATDVSYIPSPGQRVSPWADGLDGIAQAVAEYVAATGPGQIDNNLPGDGRRKARSPLATPRAWPHYMDAQLQGTLSNSTDVSRISWVLGSDDSLSVGDGSLVYLYNLNDIGVHSL